MSSTNETHEPTAGAQRKSALWVWGIPLLAAAAGAGLGVLYAVKVGCLTGGCPITSNPWLSGGLGALLGYTLVRDVLGVGRARASHADAAPEPTAGDAATASEAKGTAP